MNCPKCGSHSTGFSIRTGKLVCFEAGCFYTEGEDSGPDRRTSDRSTDSGTGPESSPGEGTDPKEGACKDS